MKNRIRSLMKPFTCIAAALAAVVLAVCPAMAESAIQWDRTMSLPSRYEQRQYSTDSTSPYIVCIPDFGKVNRYMEYAVDFRADHLPNATYLSTLCWYMGSYQLDRQYASVERDGGWAGYCGFQSLDDGRRVAIMSLWDTFCTDAQGRTSVIKARRIYPEVDPTDSFRMRDTNGNLVEWGDEGRFVQCLVPYEWEEGHTYRANIQVFNTYTGGSAYINFAVCDMETGVWTTLMQFDLGYDEAYMTGGCVFLENYLPQYAGELRSMVLSNFQVKTYGGVDWTHAVRAELMQQFDNPGSYNYGSEDDSFWAITTGLPNRCASPRTGFYTVTR